MVLLFPMMGDELLRNPDKHRGNEGGLKYGDEIYSFALSNAMVKIVVSGKTHDGRDGVRDQMTVRL